MPYGKAIELFLVNGTADSIVTAELSNWNGKAIKIPRIEVQSCNRDDITQPGVYFLFCKEDDDTDSVYIGESENVKDRLIQHIRDYQAGKEKYYWTTAVIFTGRDLNKTLIRYLENELVNLAKECKRYRMLTKNTYQNTVTKESERAVMAEFIDNIKVVINTLGYKVLEPLISKKSSELSADDELFFINTSTAKASGRTTTEGFVVMQGALINESMGKSATPAMKRMREKLGSKINDDLKTTEDLLFSSSSAAADFVLGYMVSGPQFWKNQDGRTLKEIEAEKNE